MTSSPRSTARRMAKAVPGLEPAYQRFIRPAYVRHLEAPSLQSFVDTDAAQPPGRFAELYFAHTGREAMKWVHYLGIYDQLLARFADGFVTPEQDRRPLRFLEIGVFRGGSLELWREYFGPDATIFGIDINPNCLAFSRDDLPIRIGSQADPGFLRSVIEEMGGVDVVLDDGSHVAAHQRATFDTLFPLLSPGGLYIVEDTHTAYWYEFGGGLRRPGTIIEMAKGMIDGLHKWYFRAPVGHRARLASTDVHSIQFFDSIIAFEKRIHQRPVLRSFGADTDPAAYPATDPAADPDSTGGSES
jgi:hypothetical protein